MTPLSDSKLHRSPRFLLWQGVRAAAARYPDRLAVSDGTEELTYEELLHRANGISRLLEECGVRPGDRVGILSSKSARCVATLVGCLQAGACYVPVDARAPARRSRFILENAEISLLVSEAAVLENLSRESAMDGLSLPSGLLLLDDESGEASSRLETDVVSWRNVKDHKEDFDPPARTEDDPAYVLYTSGSTGKPKGVVISHRNALTFVEWAVETFDIVPEDRLSNHAPFHFDLSVFDLYAALFSGASVHPIPERVAPFPGELARWIEEMEITVWYSVPSALVRLLTGGDLDRFDYERVRTILFAGEVFPVKHLRRVMEAFDSAGFHNLYGPTETNVCTYYSVPRPLPDPVTDLPIGEPCANIDAFALNEEGELATPGEEGELLVRGPCVMLGYWGLPDQTDRSIIQNPLHSEYRDPVYRTGDIVEVLEEGGFGFLGRRDHMVKVRGYRVELGEIETALHEHRFIREAAVVAIDDSEMGARLCAAVVPGAEDSIDETDVRKHCLDRLPRYAVPEVIRFVDALPRTSRGKTDRMKLQSDFQNAEEP